MAFIAKSLIRAVLCSGSYRPRLCRQHFNLLKSSYRLTSSLPVDSTTGVRILSPPKEIEVEVPEYDVLNIKLHGYDFPMLEGYYKYVFQLCKQLGLDPTCHATPARTTHVQTYHPGGTKIDTQLHLAKYERNIQIQDLPSTVAPIFLEVAQQNLPEGVEITVLMEEEDDDTEFRYVPDILLSELKSQVDELDQLAEERKRAK